MIWFKDTRFIRDKFNIVSTVTLIVVICGIATVNSANSDDKNKYIGHRPILGNFVTYPLGEAIQKIFEEYFHKVMKLSDDALLKIDIENDSRVYRPTSELCLNKLLIFKNNLYVLKNPIDIIPIDACLEWLYNKEPHRAAYDAEDVEQLSQGQKKWVKTMKDDSKLRNIFETTKFKKGTDFPVALKDKIYRYLSRLMDINAENPKNSCNGLWLTAYNDFIEDIYLTECEGQKDCPHFGYQGSDEDPYLRMLFKSTRDAARDCYKITQSQMRRLMNEEYENSKPVQSSLTSRLVKQTPAEKQMDGEKWSKQMMQILQLTSGVDKKEAVNLGDVVDSLDLLKNRRFETIERFTNAISEYAVGNVNMKDSSNDAQGTNRYRNAIFKLCRPYIDQEMFFSLVNVDPTEMKPFDFYGLIHSLVRLTNHVDIFGITKSTFEQDVVLTKWDSLYLATFACQIISATHAEIDYRSLNEERFDVSFREDFQDLISDWPLDQLLVSLPIIYSKTGGHKHSGPASGSSPPKKSAKFGLKFGGLFHGSSNDEATKQAPSEEPSSTKQTPSVSKPPAPLLTLEWINYWRDLHGKYPKSLPDNIHEIYPEPLLPADLTQTYPKLSSKEMIEKWPQGPPPRLREDLTPKSVAPALVVEASKPVVPQQMMAQMTPQMMPQASMIPQSPYNPSTYQLPPGAPLHPSAVPSMMQQSYGMPMVPAPEETKSDKKSHKKWFGKKKSDNDDKPKEGTQQVANGLMMPNPMMPNPMMPNPMMPNLAGLTNYQMAGYNPQAMGMNGLPVTMGNNYGPGGVRANYGPPAAAAAPNDWGRSSGPPPANYNQRDGYGSAPDYNQRPPAGNYDNRYDTNNNWRRSDDGYNGNGRSDRGWNDAPRRGGNGGGFDGPPPDSDRRRPDMDSERIYGGGRYGGNDWDRSDSGHDMRANGGRRDGGDWSAPASQGGDSWTTMSNVKF